MKDLSPLGSPCGARIGGSGPRLVRVPLGRLSVKFLVAWRWRGGFRLPPCPPFLFSVPTLFALVLCWRFGTLDFLMASFPFISTRIRWIVEFS